jgi:hypothetical protein
LAPRIGARQSPRQLRLELGSEFDRLARQAQLAAARGLAVQRCLHVINSIATLAEIPFALLKGAALIQSGYATPAARELCDVDILVPNGAARQFQSLLRSHGFRERTSTHPYYHLPVMVDDRGGAVEIHTCLPHVKTSPEEPQANFETLKTHGLFTRAPSLGTFAHLPTADLLVSHLTAHALVQHGFLPEGYPLLRLLGDLIDCQEPSPQVPRKIQDHLESSVSPAQLSALFALTAELRSGRVETAWTSSESGQLLRHMVFGALDEKYRNGLKIYYALQLMHSRGFQAFLREFGASAFAASDSDMVRIYGNNASSHPIRYRVLRPIYLLFRFATMLPDAANIALRQRVQYLGR